MNGNEIRTQMALLINKNSLHYRPIFCCRLLNQPLLYLQSDS